MSYLFVRNWLEPTSAVNSLRYRKCIDPGNATSSQPCATFIPPVPLYRLLCLTMFTSTSKKRSCWLPLRVIGPRSFTASPRSEYGVLGGTDICSLFAGMCSALPVFRGEIQCRLLGMAITTFAADGKPSSKGESGELVCLKVRREALITLRPFYSCRTWIP